MRFKNICKDQNRKDHSCYPADTELDQKEKRCFLFFHISGDQIIDRVDKLIENPSRNATVPPDTPGTLSASAIQNPLINCIMYIRLPLSSLLIFTCAVCTPYCLL